MVRDRRSDHAGAMTQMPPGAPPEAPTGPGDQPGPDDHGPRVSREEIRDLGRLRRARDERKIAGVAGGLARHLDIDPIITRVGFVVLAFFGGAGLLLYAVCWLIVPADDTGEATVRLDERSRAVALLVVGGVAALAVVGDAFGGWGFPWPLAVVGVVVLAVMLVRGNGPRRHPGPLPGPTDGTWTRATASYSRVRDNPRRRGPILFWYALAVTALGCGMLGMVDLAGVSVAASAYPAVALGVSGLTLLLGAFYGRAGGVILLGLLAAVVTAGATAADQVDAGKVTATPRTADGVDDTYGANVGEIELDLTQVGDLEALDRRTIHLSLDVGRIQVVVPEGLDVDVDAHVGAGHTRLFGADVDGSNTASHDGGVDVASITIDASIGLGEIDVRSERPSR